MHHPLPTRRAALALLAATPLTGWTQATPDDGLAAVIAGPQRSAANRARDGARHPLETLRFFNLRPDMAVVELAPGGGWFTEILAPYLRERGRLYAAHYPRDDSSESRRRARTNFELRLSREPALYDRVVVGSLPTVSVDGAAFTDINPLGGADAVLTFRNLHNWLEAGHLDDSLRAFFKILKPGGVFGVEEHRAAPGTPVAAMKTSGYMADDYVTQRCQAAGFVLEARSEVNANPRDTKDHADGVWALPPTLRGGDVGREKFLAIGESDRMTHRYRKPG